MKDFDKFFKKFKADIEAMSDEEFLKFIGADAGKADDQSFINELEEIGFYKAHKRYKDIDLWNFFWSEIYILRSNIRDLEKQLQDSKV